MSDDEGMICEHRQALQRLLVKYFRDFESFLDHNNKLMFTSSIKDQNVAAALMGIIVGVIRNNSEESHPLQWYDIITDNIPDIVFSYWEVYLCDSDSPLTLPHLTKELFSGLATDDAPQKRVERVPWHAMTSSNDKSQEAMKQVVEFLIREYLHDVEDLLTAENRIGFAAHPEDSMVGLALLGVFIGVVYCNQVHNQSWDGSFHNLTPRIAKIAVEYWSDFSCGSNDNASFSFKMPALTQVLKSKHTRFHVRSSMRMYPG